MKTLAALLILTATANAEFVDPTTGFSWVSPVETLGMIESEAKAYIRTNHSLYHTFAQRTVIWELIENVGIEEIIDIFGETQLPEEDGFRQTAGWASDGGHMVAVTNPTSTSIYLTERVTGTDDFYLLQPLPIRTAGDPLRGDNLGFWFVRVPEPSSLTLVMGAVMVALARKVNR